VVRDRPQIYWDMDGTLVDSHGAKADAFVYAFRDLADSEITVRRLHDKHAGIPRRHKIQLMGKHLLGQEESGMSIGARVDAFEEHLRSSLKNAELFHGAVEVLSEFCNVAAQVIVTAAPLHEAQHLLNELGVDQYFDRIYGFPDSKAKSIRDFRTHAGPNTVAVLVGDSEQDYLTAKECGIPFVQVASGVQEVICGGAECVYALGELPTVLHKMLTGSGYPGSSRVQQ